MGEKMKKCYKSANGYFIDKWILSRVVNSLPLNYLQCLKYITISIYGYNLQIKCYLMQFLNWSIRRSIRYKWRKRVVAVPQKEEEAEQDQHNIILLCMSRGQGLVWSRRRRKETMMIYWPAIGAVCGSLLLINGISFFSCQLIVIDFFDFCLVLNGFPCYTYLRRLVD